MTAGFRCSSASRELPEPLEGTASTVRSFLLVEHAGPWGAQALHDARIDEEVKRLLRSLEPVSGIRPLLIRRHRGAPRDGVRVFAAHVGPARPWLEGAHLGDVRELLDLDLRPLGEARSLGLAPQERPVQLVCTHGRHDRCCAELGRPLAAAMSRESPEQTWEVSHIGGDRFAPNVLVLPHGLYYGRLSASDAAGFVSGHRSGMLDLEHLRGRSAYPLAIQAADIYLRRHLGVRDLAALGLREHARSGPQSRVVFDVAQARWQVTVDSRPGAPRQLTCSGLRRSAAPVHRLVQITASSPR